MIETREQYERAMKSVERCERSAADFERQLQIAHPTLNPATILKGITSMRRHVEALQREIADYNARTARGGTSAAG
jgi:hypothetical protein